jgi:secondary thiamine-phosphate synthase enzyme
MGEPVEGSFLGGRALSREKCAALCASPGPVARDLYRRSLARAPLTSAAVKVFQHERRLRTAGGLSVRDITDEVSESVRESGVRDGIVCVYSPHTTCCVRVNEFEDGFLQDFTALLKSLVPSDKYYAHDDWDRRTENICEEDMQVGNGHAHCMSMILGSAGESIPVGDGELCMGQWQRVLFIELDRSRPRRWICKVVGS